MFIKAETTLIYEGQGVTDNGSPIVLTYEVPNVKVNEMETFSNNYYNDQQRNMRLSRNLVIPTYLTDDYIDCQGNRYELMYCIYDNKKYRVKNILKYNGNKYNRGYTRQKMILDIQELR